MTPEIRGLLDQLQAAEDFETAAQATLEALLRVAERALARSVDGPHQATLLQALIHLRPDRGYRGLSVRRARPGPGNQDATPLTSSTAWRWIESRRQAAIFDVTMKAFWHGDGPPVSLDRASPFQSCSALLGHGATHLVLLPLGRRGDQVDGMVSLELSCREAIGARFTRLASGMADLQLLADLAAPTLAALPQRAVDEAQTCDLLPVIGCSMAPIVAMLGAFARFDETLLLRGETGTGKSHLAHWVARRSGRPEGPFVTVQLHALPESLREGELFGWRKGAFTGAVSERTGAVQRAQGGTLFIDELDKLPTDAQGKLLRLLEERRFTVLGESVERAADVRFVVGTNVDLEAAVAEGTVLEDLYYRVNVLPVELPPLRERRDEIPAWGEALLQSLHDRHGAGRASLSPTAERLLAAQDWPGNLRQLNSVIVRAYALSMATRGGALANGAHLGAADVERALALDGGAKTRPVLQSLQAAADAFVTEAEWRQEHDLPPLDLDLTDAFCGCVLTAAAERLGDEKEAFRLFGLEHRLKGGSYLKTFRREQERVAALAAALEATRKAS